MASVLGGVVLSAGGVFAYWTSTGQGAGSATTDTLQPVTVAAFSGGDAPSSTLLPGGASADVILRVNNTNSYSVTLVSVVGNGTITADVGHPTCTTTAVTFANQTGLSSSVPAGSSLIHLPGAAAMGAGSSNGCQGATFNIPVSITVHTP